MFGSGRIKDFSCPRNFEKAREFAKPIRLKGARVETNEVADSGLWVIEVWNTALRMVFVRNVTAGPQ